VVGADTLNPTPTANKQKYTPQTNAQSLGFSIADFVYFGYGIANPTGAACSVAANNNAVYTFFANGDLDGDSTMSTFELAAGTDGDNSLYHAKGFFINNEIE
jgi:hypothetical protein